MREKYVTFMTIIKGNKSIILLRLIFQRSVQKQGMEVAYIGHLYI